METPRLEETAKLLRYYCAVITTKAGSGHLTSCLSAADLAAALVFGGYFHFNVQNPPDRANDRLIFSKGHASALLYAIWAAAGKMTEEELLSFRQFGSVLEGHPTPAFPFSPIASGSLGQGLSVGLGMALAAKYLDKLPSRVFVLLGDGEMAEGQVWEAIQIAAHYELDNLVGILDLNRLGQSGPTMLGKDAGKYQQRLEAFGWNAIVVDGHDIKKILDALKNVETFKGKPTMIIARTVKGKGVSFLEDKENWHGRTLDQKELRAAVKEIGAVDKNLKMRIPLPKKGAIQSPFKAKNFLATLKPTYQKGELVPTRKAYGNALARIAVKYRDMVVLDGDVKNSTFSEIFQKHFPDLFFEMYIAEQNMASVGVGLSVSGKLPFVSTFSAFLTRAHDQIRMAGYTGSHIIFCGSHGGVSVGADGPSQMGLEDLAMFRTVPNSVIFYPADAVSCDKLVEEAAKYHNLIYLRTTRMASPVIYGQDEDFLVGGSKVLRKSKKDKATIIAAGITVYEALAAHNELAKQGIHVRVIDAYSIKPLDTDTIKRAAKQTARIITVEDHYLQGGLGEAVARTLAAEQAEVHCLAVKKIPKSGMPEELLQFEDIDSRAIVKKVKDLCSNK